MLDCVKSPLAAMLVMVSGAEPLFVSTTCCTSLPTPTGWFVKVRLEADKLAMGCSSPVPVSITTWGLPAALSVMVRAATLEPGVDGVYVTVMTQFVVAWSGTAQLFVSGKVAAGSDSRNDQG